MDTILNLNVYEFSLYLKKINDDNKFEIIYKYIMKNVIEILEIFENKRNPNLKCTIKINAWYKLIFYFFEKTNYKSRNKYDNYKLYKMYKILNCIGKFYLQKNTKVIDKILMYEEGLLEEDLFLIYCKFLIENKLYNKLVNLLDRTEDKLTNINYGLFSIKIVYMVRVLYEKHILLKNVYSDDYSGNYFYYCDKILKKEIEEYDNSPSIIRIETLCIMFKYLINQNKNINDEYDYEETLYYANLLLFEIEHNVDWNEPIILYSELLFNKYDIELSDIYEEVLIYFVKYYTKNKYTLNLFITKLKLKDYHDNYDPSDDSVFLEKFININHEELFSKNNDDSSDDDNSSDEYEDNDYEKFF